MEFWTPLDIKFDVCADVAEDTTNTLTESTFKVEFVSSKKSICYRVVVSVLCRHK